MSVPSPSPSSMSTVPLKDMFVAGHISRIGTKGRGVGSVTLIMKRQRGKRDKQYRSESNDEDFKLMSLMSNKTKEGEGNSVVITRWEIAEKTPRLVLLCSEETKLVYHIEFKETREMW